MRRIRPSDALFALFACALASAPARALPRYSAIYGQDCQLCHHDPTGGGLRSGYAAQYLVPRELAWRQVELEALERIEPALGEHLRLGADLRLLAQDVESEGSLLFTMQSDVHVGLELDERTSIVVDLGAGRRSEAYGLLRVPFAHGWIRGGRFVPAYGWRFADHPTFVRSRLLDRQGSTSPAVWEDSGLEFGIAPGSLRLTLSALGGGGDVGESGTVRLVARRSLGSLNLALGASALRRERTDGHRRAAGIFGYAHLGRVGWLGQWDEPREDDGRRERILTQQAHLVLARGWTLLFGHDVHDPDRDRQSGLRQRWSAGVDALLTPFVGATLWVRHDDPDRGVDVADPERLSAEFVLHFLF